MSRASVDQVALLGPRRSMVGIVTPGAPTEAAGGRQVAVVLNSGIVHRVGTNRMSVTLARAMAAAGVTVLRFDLSGIGDSEPRNDGLAPVLGGLADIREALDTFPPSDNGGVILVGLCSGADLALLYASTDPRITGLVLLDPTIPRTRGYYLRHYARAISRPSNWRKVLTLRHPALRALLTGAPRSHVPGPVEFDPDSTEVREHLQRAYDAVLARGVQILAVFTSGRAHRQNYRDQLLDAFPGVAWGRQLELLFFSPCDHTFTPEDQRKRLMTDVLRWMRTTVFVSPPEAA